MTLFILWQIVCSTLIALLFAAISGSLGPVTSAISLILGAIASYFVSRADAVSKTLFIDPKNKTVETLWLERLTVVFIMYLSYRHFLYMFYEVGAEFKTLNVNNYGDLPLHINYIRQVAGGSSFPWVNPSFSLDLLRYPLGIDLYNALWEAIGVRLPAHLFIVGLVCSAMIVRMVRIAASWWGLIGLYLSGGFAGWTSTNASPTEIQAALAWKNIFLAVITTQRGFLFALPAGLYLILRARKPEKLSWTFGLMWGALAFFHLHTFAIVSLIIGGEALLRRDVRRFFNSLLIAVPIGSAFVFYSSMGLKSGSFIRWQWGWTNTQLSTFNYLNYNFGPYLYLVFGFGFYFAAQAFLNRKEPDYNSQVAQRYFLHFALFILFFNLIVAPWDWDNIKVLIWPYLLILGAWATVNHQLRPGFQTVFAVLIGFSGFTAVVPTLVSTSSAAGIYQQGELAKVKAALSQVPRASVFAAATTHNHPLTFFGRERAIGYEGHLWSHGIQSQDQVAKLKKIFADDPAWRELARELRITHIYWGNDERTLFGHQARSWQVPENNVSKVEDIAIYEIK